MSELAMPLRGSPIIIAKLADGMIFIGGIIIFCAVLWFAYSVNHTLAAAQYNLGSPDGVQRELSCLWSRSDTFSPAPGLQWRCDSIAYSTLPLWIGIAGVIGGGFLRYASVKKKLRMDTRR